MDEAVLCMVDVGVGMVGRIRRRWWIDDRGHDGVIEVSCEYMFYFLLVGIFLGHVCMNVVQRRLMDIAMRRAESHH